MFLSCSEINFAFILLFTKAYVSGFQRETINQTLWCRSLKRFLNCKDILMLEMTAGAKRGQEGRRVRPVQDYSRGEGVCSHVNLSVRKELSLFQGWIRTEWVGGWWVEEGCLVSLPIGPLLSPLTSLIEAQREEHFLYYHRGKDKNWENEKNV